jgi:DNA-binding NarL/FixJ family response regulator
MKQIRVLLAEDHSIVRAGIRALVGELVDVQVVGEAGEGPEALELIRQVRPDVVLMDIAMPGLNGLEVAARVIKEYPEIRVIILSGYANEEYVLQALRAGVAGYLLKDSELTELGLAIRSVSQGKTYLSPVISRQVVTDYVARMSGRTEEKESRSGPFTLLTPRQREILQLIAEGHTTKEMAVKLNLSVKTAEAHRTQLMERLDIHEVAGLVRYAIREGIIQ